MTSRVGTRLTGIRAVTVEPCLMCLGAAVAPGVNRVWFSLESPTDGAAELLRGWQPPVRSPHFVDPGEVRGDFDVTNPGRCSTGTQREQVRQECAGGRGSSAVSSGEVLAAWVAIKASDLQRSRCVPAPR